MIVAEAEHCVAALVAPIALDRFLEAVRGGESIDTASDTGHRRAALLGSDPAATILAAFKTHATGLDCHSPAPLALPPEAGTIATAADFGALVRAYHDRNYTVRIPKAPSLHPRAQAVARALEILIHAPVDASVFWSRAGARAKVHYDNNDNIAIQLTGRKRWFVSTEPWNPRNPWRDPGEGETQLGAHRVVDAEPGDLLFIPRGLAHCVESTTDSIHLALLFTPLPWRAAGVVVVVVVVCIMR